MVQLKGYKRNVFNESKCIIGTPLGYGLGTIFELAFGKTLQDAHNSLMDACVQARIFADPIVQLDFDCPQFVILLDGIWSGKKKHDTEYTMEMPHAVPFGWTDRY